MENDTSESKAGMTGMRRILAWAVPLILLMAAAAIFIIGVNEKIPFMVWKVPDDMFSAVKQGGYSKAYKYMSTNFRKTNDLAAFRSFMEANRFIANSEKTTYEQPKIAGDRASVRGVMLSQGEKMGMEFEMAREDGKWKIGRMAFSGTGSGSGKGAVVRRVAVGTGFDAKAKDLTGPGDVFNSDEPDLYCLVEIIGAAKGTEVEATLSGPGGIKVGPLRVPTQGSGVSSPIFRFTRPASGWQLGKWKLEVKVAGNKAGESGFTVK